MMRAFVFFAVDLLGNAQVGWSGNCNCELLGGQKKKTIKGKQKGEPSGSAAKEPQGITIAHEASS